MVSSNQRPTVPISGKILKPRDGYRRMSHAETFLAAAGRVCREISVDSIEALARELAALRERGGRLFLIGVGGGAGNCSHAVNDFRKLCGIEAYSPVDNVSDLTARTTAAACAPLFPAS